MKKSYKRVLAMLCCLALFLAIGRPVYAGSSTSVPAAGSAGQTEQETQSDSPVESGSVTSEGASPETDDADITDEDLPPEEIMSKEETQEAPTSAQSEAVEDASAPYGPELDENSTVVNTYAELQKALGEDNAFTTIYLGADITADGSAAPFTPTNLLLLSTAARLRAGATPLPSILPTTQPAFLQ